MNRFLKIAALSATLVVGTAGAAFATKAPDPCPDQHVAIYAESNKPVEGQFICGPVKGDKGDTGDTGATGPQGPVGATGATGEQGPAGDTGPSGPAGADGKDGATGPAGQDGVNGQDGKNGNDGATGPAGVDGAVGATGAAGTPADSTEIANLRAVVTELNNRLFILEHAAPADTTTTTAPAAPAQAPAAPGTLPHTGSNATLYLLGAGIMCLLIGGALRFARR